MSAAEPLYLNLRQAAQHICQSPHPKEPSLLRTPRIPTNLGPKDRLSFERVGLDTHTEKANSVAIERPFCFCEMKCRNFFHFERLSSWTGQKKITLVRLSRWLS
jgi:hypothetical protein